jgi:hypothetical protein
MLEPAVLAAIDSRRRKAFFWKVLLIVTVLVTLLVTIFTLCLMFLTSLKQAVAKYVVYLLLGTWTASFVILDVILASRTTDRRLSPSTSEQRTSERSKQDTGPSSKGIIAIETNRSWRRPKPDGTLCSVRRRLSKRLK